ncbi:MAG: nucleoside phosphorylase [bacterium]
MEYSDFPDLHLQQAPVLTPQMTTNRLKKSKDFCFSKYVILGFSPFLYSYIKKEFSGVSTGYVNKLFPYYTFKFDSQLITFQFPGLGAPLTGALLEESIALGGEIFIFFGSTGILKEDIVQDNLIIPSGALRDEGTSFHYIQSGRYSYPDKHLMSLINKTFKKSGYVTHKGRVWTTDGVYRETPSKIQKVKREGCIAVDMEASALFTIAKFHKKRIAGFFVPSDLVSLKGWKQYKSGNDKIKPVKLLHLALDIIKQCRKE